MTEHAVVIAGGGPTWLMLSGEGPAPAASTLGHWIVRTMGSRLSRKVSRSTKLVASMRWYARAIRSISAAGIPIVAPEALSACQTSDRRKGGRTSHGVFVRTSSIASSSASSPRTSPRTSDTLCCSARRASAADLASTIDRDFSSCSCRIRSTRRARGRPPRTPANVAARAAT